MNEVSNSTEERKESWLVGLLDLECFILLTCLSVETPAKSMRAPCCSEPASPRARGSSAPLGLPISRASSRRASKAQSTFVFVLLHSILVFLLYPHPQPFSRASTLTRSPTPPASRYRRISNRNQRPPAHIDDASSKRDSLGRDEDDVAVALLEALRRLDLPGSGVGGALVRRTGSSSSGHRIEERRSRVE